VSSPVTFGARYERKDIEVVTTIRTDEMEVCKPKIIYQRKKTGRVFRRERILQVHRMYNVMFDYYTTEITPLD
jgi:hypothetical protein